MNISNIEKAWGSSKILLRSHNECKVGIKAVYSKMDLIIQSPPDTPEQFSVGMRAIPDEFLSLRRNIFSTLFQASYHLLKVSEERRLLYAKLNRLFRIWVTSADNLLDNEDKVVVPLRIEADSHVMHQVISIMAADRVLKEILDEAVENKVISSSDSRTLANKSLQILLPSAAEEALEEKGIESHPDPEHVLYTIHRMKTGILFNIPFLGLESIESSIDFEILEKMKTAFNKFGLGCQLIDDIRDISRDYSEKRYNYVLSQIFYNNHMPYIAALEKINDSEKPGNKLFIHFPEVVNPTAQLAKTLLSEALFSLDSLGLHISTKTVNLMTNSMFKMLDVEELL